MGGGGRMEGRWVSGYRWVCMKECRCEVEVCEFVYGVHGCAVLVCTG